MENITIKKVVIKSFRNIKDLSFDCTLNTVIYGNNMVGKTNTLNAIMWCLCGVDLNNASDDIKNVPFGITESPNAIDVTVELNTGTIQRIADLKNNRVSQRIIIDGNEVNGVKNGEIAIDSKLGLLELTLKDTKKFRIRRFLLNPNYYLSIEQKDLREYFVNTFSKVDDKSVVENSNLSNASKKNLLSGIATYGSFANYSKTVADDIKKCKATLTSLDFAKKWMQEHNVLCGGIDDEIAELQKKQLANTEKVAYIEEGGVVLAQALSSYLYKNCPIQIITLEKGQGENIWKEVCYPKLLGNNRNLNIVQGSKSELTLTSISFIQTFADTMLNHTTLPILIDDGECMDDRMFSVITQRRNVQPQLIITKVAPKQQNEIEIKGE